MAFKTNPMLLGFLVILLTLQQSFAIRGGDCSPVLPNGVFEVANLIDIDNFIADCDRLLGSLKISCDNSNSTYAIQDLEVFQYVTEIQGYLVIENCPHLQSVDGLRSLTKIGGQSLYGGYEYSLYISNNDLLPDLGGLSNLQEISGKGLVGGGNIGIDSNPQLCYVSTIDWSLLAGERWDRVVRVEDSTSCSTSTSTCHATCTCSGCSGPEADDCQLTCDNDDKRDTYIIVGIVVACIFFGLLAFFIWMCFTRRCGCRLRVKETFLEMGGIPGLPFASTPSSFEKKTPTHQPSDFRRAPSPKHDPLGAVFDLGGVGLPDHTSGQDEDDGPSGPVARRGSRKIEPL